MENNEDFIYNDNHDDNIRPPDEIINEQLLEDNRSDFEKEIEKAAYLSKKEFEQLIQRENEYEKYVIQDYINLVNIVKTKFQPLLNDLKRLSKIDDELREIYDIIEPIIDSYCNQLLPFVEFDETTYNRIFKVLGSIRTDKKCIEELKKIIIKE